MKKLLLLVIPTLFSGAVMAKAGESTLSFGYLNVKSGGEKILTEKADTTKPDPEGIATVYADGYSKAGGAFVRYRYEFSDDCGVISSFAYSKTDYNKLITLNIDKQTSKHTSNVKGDYMSLMVGPAYRINEYLSIYGLVGLGYSNVNFDLDVTKYGKKSFQKAALT
ncbi:Attachment invasion locus protein [Arsenophonus endosymbiont of Aleurodicus floccissimus]|uniref:Ail/Lom family outer membrane beta-barrel protein n=1 Tax=Arsenophonus endosymbiont of Aleurodicus floccissimus TaxID=2152761 RepID=UPI000EB9DC35|nr:Ail/Lom family outer membrane beta-barrel protein [Arsenophonus endosymbiont of Aleurodicus floccissimus]SPP31502.1 Attachment invasion locus protein [Arsenophonus endosymbiont of Aleurodicus floccissimus]